MESVEQTHVVVLKFRNKWDVFMKGPCYMESFADNIVPRKPVGIRINTCTTVVVVQLELEINHAFTQKAIFTGITGMKNFPGFFSLSLFHN